MTHLINLTFRTSALAAAGALIFAMFIAPTDARAGDLALGKEKAVTCAACHGQDFKSPIDPSYAVLAGQHEGYLVQALKDYRSGQRNNAIMAGMAAPLSNDDIYNLAAYLSSLPGPLGYKK